MIASFLKIDDKAAMKGRWSVRRRSRSTYWQRKERLPEDKIPAEGDQEPGFKPRNIILNQKDHALFNEPRQ